VIELSIRGNVQATDELQLHLFRAHEALRLQKLDNPAKLLAVERMYPLQTPEPALPGTDLSTLKSRLWPPSPPCLSMHVKPHMHEHPDNIAAQHVQESQHTWLLCITHSTVRCSPDVVAGVVHNGQLLSAAPWTNIRIGAFERIAYRLHASQLH
jgi:hypothetical protein